MESSNAPPWVDSDISSRLVVFPDSEIKEGPSDVARLGELSAESGRLDEGLGRLRELLLPSIASAIIRKVVR